MRERTRVEERNRAGEIKQKAKRRKVIKEGADMDGERGNYRLD